MGRDNTDSGQRAMTTIGRQDRVYGCLIAGAVGDALGAGVEFSSLAEIRDQWGPDGVVGYVPAYGIQGAITDDTQMTLLTVEALRRALTWFAEASYRHAVENAAMTHGHDTALASSGALAMIVRHLLDGVDLRRPGEQTRGRLILDRALDTAETYGALGKVLNASLTATSTPDTVEALGGWWVADEALAIGVYCALVHEHDPRRALLLAANHGGDSDSTAAIAGSLLDAAQGPSGLPSEWIVRNEATSLIADLVKAFMTAMPPAGRDAADRGAGTSLFDLGGGQASPITMSPESWS